MNITNRFIHEVQQGTGPWLRLREGFNTGSEASAALGVSKYVTRAELLRRKHTGVGAEPDAATLGRFEAGHAAEARARPLAEQTVDAELFPVTVTCEVDGLQLLASLDGLTLDETIAWETKLWNEELAAAVRAGDLPAHYTVQMDQALLVTGAERCLFTCTDGTPERYVHCWYERDEAKFAALLDGWRQFNADLQNYTLQPRPEPVAPQVVENLPAVAVRMDGALVVQSNLPAFGMALREFVDRVPKRPSTDTEFAQTEAACKALKRAEEALDAAEANALASLADVNTMRRMVADFRELARTTRLASEKMVERRKAEVKEEAVAKARKAMDAHIAALNAELAPFRVPLITADFAGAIKGLKSVASMQDKLDGLLATTKIAAEVEARAIRGNVTTFKQEAEGHEFLFADLGQIISRPADDFRALVQGRIAQHKVAEAEREAKRKAAEELAAQQAESARLEALAAANRARLAAEAQAEAAAAVGVVAAPGQYPPPSAPTVPAILDQQYPEVRGAKPRADEPATLKLGTICERLGVTMTAAFLADVLHVKAAKTDGRAVLFRESQFPVICRQLQSHVSAMAELYAGEVAA